MSETFTFRRKTYRNPVVRLERLEMDNLGRGKRKSGYRRIRQPSDGSDLESDKGKKKRKVNPKKKVQVQVKQEKMSSADESETNYYDNIPIKLEPQSENDDPQQNNSSGELPEKKKRFRRIKPISESDSDSEVDKAKTSRQAQKKKKAPYRRDVTKKKESDSDDSSSSDSTSTKGSIQFESSDDDVGTDKSYTSSETDEIDDDGSKKLCIVCQNLGNAKVIGRSKTTSTSWCKCGCCKIIGDMKDYDRICCREIKDIIVFLDEEIDDASKNKVCLTSHPRFVRDVVQCQALSRTGGYRRTDNYGNNDAYMGSWSYIRMIWDRLGWGTRMVIPACVSARLKEAHGTSYIKSFTAITTCETAKHCVQSQR